MLYTFGRREVYTEFWWGNRRERDKLEDLGGRVENNIKI